MENMPAKLLHMNHNTYLQMNKKKLDLTGLTCLRPYDVSTLRSASSKVYDMPFNSYKLKEYLVGLARALQIVDPGTVAELTERIKAHLLENPNLANNPRFSGLFTSCRRAPQQQPQPEIESGPSSQSTSVEQSLARFQVHHPNQYYFPPNYLANYHYHTYNNYPAAPQDDYPS